MIRALLFDLDGTLLNVDIDYFLEQYIRALTPRLAHKMPPEKFARQLMASSMAMIQNTDPAKTNQQKFIEDFFGKTGLSVEETMPIFDDFYANDFPKLKRHSRTDPNARRVVEAAVKRGYEVVLATNPVFPMSAIRERMRWAEVNDFDYLLVTAYEDMHFCKPYPQYYTEILNRIGRRPEECLMVGNDVDEDLSAARLGMKTYLVHDCLLNRNNAQYSADFEGQLSDLADFIKSGKVDELAEQRRISSSTAGCEA